MNITDSEKVLREVLNRIAPEIEIETINRNADLRDEFDIDSMDFLNLVTALSERLKKPMPEADYAQMATYDELVAYLNS